MNAAALPEDLKSELLSHLTIAGIVLLAVVGFQAVTLALVACQCSAVDPLNQGLLDDDEAALLASTRLRNARSGRNKEQPEKLVSDEDLEAAASASNRYKSGKAAEYYSKYGVK